MDRVLIVDDDVQLCSLLSERLRSEDFETEAVHNGSNGLERALSGDHSLVILDLMLPQMNGLDVLRRLRAQSSIPVLILTARGEEVERVLGLEIGADDYLPKPFSPRELIARIRAILRRTKGVSVSTAPVVAGDLHLDPSAREASLKGRTLALTTLEFTLLETLVRNAGHVVSRESLTETVLGRKLGPFDRVIDVHVSNLRKKLATKEKRERIKAVRNAGYLFVVRPDAE